MPELRWKDRAGGECVVVDGRVSIFAKPTLTRDDGVVAVGVEMDLHGLPPELIEVAAAALHAGPIPWADLPGDMKQETREAASRALGAVMDLEPPYGATDAALYSKVVLPAAAQALDGGAPEPESPEPSRAHGHVYVELQLSGQHAMSRVTAGWSEPEIQELLAGSPEARQEAIDEATRRVRQAPDAVEIVIASLHVSDAPVLSS